MGAVRTPGVYPPSRRVQMGCPTPLIASIRIQNHMNFGADGHSLRTGNRRHQNPKAHSPMLITINPSSRSDEIRPDKNMAGGKDS